MMTKTVLGVELFMFNILLVAFNPTLEISTQRAEVEQGRTFDEEQVTIIVDEDNLGFFDDFQ